MKVWLNGALVEDGEACISPGDHGFLLGDGVFETLRCYAGRPFALDQHLGRLEGGAAALGIEPLQRAVLTHAVQEVVDANQLTDARMRITLTSGTGPPGLMRGETRPTVLITTQPLQPWPPTATAILSRWRRDERSPLAGVKTISLAESVVVLREARAQGADEAIVLNRRDELCEASTANVFCVRAGRVETPSLASGCLAGITREHVLRVCRDEGLECQETELPAAVLHDAEELFLTSSTREIQPVVAVGGRPVGSGEPGAVTRRLARAYSEAVLAQLELE